MNNTLVTDRFHRRALMLAAGLFLAVPAGLFGGSFLTEGLPPGNVIVNIDARQDGAAAYSGVGPALWYQPFSSLGANHLLTYPLPAGTYAFRVIDAADALQQFPTLPPSQTAGMFTGWTFNSPWATDYLVFTDAALTDPKLPQLLDGAFSNADGVNWRTYPDGPTAYRAAITNGFYNLIRTGAAGRAGTNAQTTLTLTVPTRLVFAVPDYFLPDNNGGVSVLISPAAPAVAPVLTIQPGSSGTVALRWPTNAVGFRLESELNLFPAAWAPVAASPVAKGSDWLVTLPVDAVRKFFRLRHE